MTKRKSNKSKTSNVTSLVGPSGDMDWLARAIDASLRNSPRERRMSINLERREAEMLVAFIDAANGKTDDPTDDPTEDPTEATETEGSDQ